ncbi:MAG: DUF4148 domain-containing protein [Ramlibacter sp.]
MKSKSILAIAAFAALASVGAQAGQAGEADLSAGPSGQVAVQAQAARTRADVQAELAQYQKAGVNPWSIRYNQLTGFRSVKTRDEVRAEYMAERNEVAAMNGEDSGSAYLAQAAAAGTRADRGNNFAGTPANAQ